MRVLCGVAGLVMLIVGIILCLIIFAPFILMIGAGVWCFYCAFCEFFGLGGEPPDIVMGLMSCFVGLLLICMPCAIISASNTVHNVADRFMRFVRD